jgi:hypothetical protein
MNERLPHFVQRFVVQVLASKGSGINGPKARVASFDDVLLNQGGRCHPKVPLLGRVDI